MRPSTASVVTRTDGSRGRRSHMAAAQGRRCELGPMSIYEVHLGSWRRKRRRRHCCATTNSPSQLIPYAVGHGLHAYRADARLGASARCVVGLPAVGLFAPTRPSAMRPGFQRFVDRAPQAGLGVILDWVPAHFPPTSTASSISTAAPLRAPRSAPRLTPRLEHRHLRFRPPRSSAISSPPARSIGSTGTTSTGLRVDAVASMLYLDYSRKAGEWLPNAEGGNENRDAVRVSAETRTSWSIAAVPRRHDDGGGIDGLAGGFASRESRAGSASTTSGTWAG